ncbi:MAG: PEP-CTERM sorting domain-containing protein, partial [Phycisphaerae bacterium]
RKNRIVTWDWLYMILPCGLSMAAALAATALTASAALGSIDGTVLFNPYLFSSLGTLNVTSGTLNINTGTSTTAPTLSFGSASYTGIINNQNGMAEGAANGIPYVGLFDFSSINIGSGVTVNITGTNALALLSQSSANIAATLSLDGSLDTPTGAAGGPGGFAGGNGPFLPTNGQGPGGGGASNASVNIYLGTGGAIYGNLEEALYGGSGGGGLHGPTILGGGGAMDITSVAGLTVGQVNANGSFGGGGGSGGGIILSGSTISASLVSAGGGTGGGDGSSGGGGFGGSGGSGAYLGGGDGGGGRILVQSTSANQSTSFANVGNGVVTVEQIAQLEPPGSLLAPSNIVFGQVRTGTTAVQNLSFQNSGSTGTVTGQYTPALPSGMSANSGTFSLAGGQSSTSAISFAPISRGTYSGTVSYTSTVVNGSVAVTGTAVGPVFSTNVGTTPLTVINVGKTAPGLAATFDLKITNTSTDDVNGTNLANLTLESENITGPTANAFYVVPLTQNVLGNAAADSPLGNSTDLSIVFNPTTDGSFTDYLTITTDQGAPLGDVGQQFTYELTGTSSGTPTPEPATLALLTLGGLSLLMVRRKKLRV